ncbi:MAG: hypothetical protein A2Y25_06510 [Candidatus Melainabacteria bacterium GWF2_37_15]|nr:MAG: hypothetical protein A2Y25_06510 [Candidatus Melainabacteria bacterium GWF2_37_15]
MNGDFLAIRPLLEEKDTELFLIFNLAEKTYAVPAEKIREIVQIPALTVIEKFPEYIIGLLNLRGQIINILDLSKLLGLESQTYTTDYQVLILDCNEKSVGIVVSSIKDVTMLDKKYFTPLPYKSNEKIITGIYKHDDSLIAFLDIELILQSVENVEINSMEVEKVSIPQKYFPTDPISKTKLLKRAEKLQKEARVDTGNLNYQENYFISFCMEKEIYAINLKYVKEITKLKLVSFVSVPCVPEFITGIINLRGEFITIVDIKYFLQITKTPISEKTKVIVVKISDIQIGILVDDVFDIENIPTEKMNLNIQTKYEKNKYTLAEVLLPDNKVMSIFDMKKFVEDERLFIEDSV